MKFMIHSLTQFFGGKVVAVRVHEVNAEVG